MEEKFNVMYMNHKSNKHDEWYEGGEIENPKKRAGPSIQGTVKTQMDGSSVSVNSSHCPHV